jgi:hypothetical protein
LEILQLNPGCKYKIKISEGKGETRMGREGEEETRDADPSGCCDYCIILFLKSEERGCIKFWNVVEIRRMT